MIGYKCHESVANSGCNKTEISVRADKTVSGHEFLSPAPIQVGSLHGEPSD